MLSIGLDFKFHTTPAIRTRSQRLASQTAGPDVLEVFRCFHFSYQIVDTHKNAFSNNNQQSYMLGCAGTERSMTRTGCVDRNQNRIGKKSVVIATRPQ
jgi:hypothetical protein